jgi:uncharacterized protein (DUF58 family)
VVKSPRKEIKLRINYSGRGVETSSLGLVFLCITVVVGFGALNTGNNLLYLILSTLVALLLLSVLYIRIGLSGIEADLEFPGEAFAGEPVVVRSTLRNKKRFLPSLGLALNSGRTKKTVKRLSFLFPYLMPGENKTLRKIVRFARRGEYADQTLFLQTDYPFGFFRKFRAFPCGKKMLVYPAPVPVPALEAFVESWGAGRSKGARGDREGDSFFGIKEYLPGEDYRRIHWKASAKSDRLMVKEFQMEKYDRIEICLDRFLPEPADEAVREKFEYLVSGAATLAMSCLDRELPVCVAIPDPESRQIALYETREEILYQLALVKPIKGGEAYSHWACGEHCCLFFTLNEPRHLRRHLPDSYRLVRCRQNRFSVA